MLRTCKYSCSHSWLHSWLPPCCFLTPAPVRPRPLCRPCRRHFDLGLDPRCVYELDSSTPAKFSRHLTLRLPGHAFANNHAMGKFVAQVRGWPKSGAASSGQQYKGVRGNCKIV